MGTSPTPTTWIRLGSIALAALAAGYILGRISADSDNRPPPHQDVASKDDPELRSTLSATQKRLASCEKTLQRRDHHLQTREGKPHTNEDKPTPSPEPELPKQCIISSAATQVHTLSANCTNFRRHFDAYKAILGSSTIDCESVLSIRDLARNQHSICAAIAKTFEDGSHSDLMSDIRGIDAMENSHMLRNEYGDIDINDLVKNPECIARIQAE
ncbi:hypothetical protein WMF11_08680 [Sorangium sp. So ce295]|uniref:hypothetical protein n=1 Tax=Sorangium sp. So ce295 TaxID=3133295 RepID=UPI003F636FEC